MHSVLCFLAPLFLAGTSHLLPAQTPAAKPANATGICRDGTYSTASAKSGACQGHKGVQQWYAATAAAPSSAPAPAASLAKSASAAPASNQPSASTQPASAQSASAANKGPKANLANTPAAPGGAPNLVWVNTASNVYHCPGTDFYGKTKTGAYMTEADAKAKGAHGNRGATCAK